MKVTQDHIDLLSRFIVKKSFWCFTIKDIKHFLYNELADYEKISNSTINRILTQKLKMRYKKAAKFSKKTFLVDNKRKLFESAMVLIWLDNNDYELIYVDYFFILSQANQQLLMGSNRQNMIHPVKFSRI